MGNNKAFRQQKVWKNFREKLLKERGYACEMCGTKRNKGKGLHIHHLAPNAYAILYEPWFRVLCPTCHRCILERFLRKKNWGKYEQFIRAWLEDFIPFGVLNKSFPGDYETVVIAKEFSIKD